MKSNLLILILLISTAHISFCQQNCITYRNLNFTKLTIDSKTSLLSNSTFFEKHIVIKSGNEFDSSMKFERCIVEIDNTFIYNNPGKLEFYDCEILFKDYTSGFRPKTVSGGPSWAYIVMPVEFIFEGNCMTTIFDDSPEVFHIKGGSIKFTNNNVILFNNEGSHFMHISELDHTKDNSFYGNTISTASGNILAIEDPNFTKLGNNFQAKNIFYSPRGFCIYSFGAPNFVDFKIENSEFESNPSTIIGDAVALSRGNISIDNCLIKNSITGLRIEYANLKVLNSRFENCVRGIQKQSGELEVKESTFKDCYSGIFLPSSNPHYGNAVIEGNTFINNQIDFLAQGGSIDGYTLRRNDFSGKEYGMLIDGDNQFNTENNNFINSYGGAIVNAAGSNTNLHINNLFSSTLVGIQTQGDNSLYQSLQNCFSTGAGDLYLEGSVFIQMGNSNVGAGNCFTKNGVPDIIAVTNNFEYFKDPLAVNNCFDPITGSIYTEAFADSRPTEICGGSGTPITPTVRWNYCYPSKKLTCAEIESYILSVQNEINLTTSTVSISPTNKANILRFLNACKLRLLKLQLFNCRPDAPTPQPDIINSSRLKEKADIISMAIIDADYPLASNLLDNLSDNSEEAIDFVKIQRINIQRLVLSSAFTLSAIDKNTLLNITTKNHPMAGYARGLYYILTGEVILPSIIRHQAPENRERSDDFLFVDVHPNPILDKINIEISDAKTQYTSTIYDIYGRVIDESSKQMGNHTIECGDWSHGVYIISIDSGNKNIKTLKMVK